MKIGEAARRSGLPTKTIRFYEQIGLIGGRGREANGYRVYDTADVHRLRFVARARALGFSVEQCRELLALYADRDRASADVKALALAHVDQIDGRIAELRAMKVTLLGLAERCHGDERPDCPILEELAADR
ncbi:MAG: Cu(I)-responsive transcriptional regulator [Pseudomonadota bacterium]